MEKRYWKGIEELRNDAEFVKLKNNEFAEHIPVDEILSEKSARNENSSRRDFLKFMGFSIAAVSLASCETPVTKAIPYVIKPEEITPGVANWYASTFFDGYDYCSIVVKTREGRPIKINGNTLSGITGGGTNARVQASVLSLYDSARLRQPMMNGNPSDWVEADTEISKRLAAIASRNGKVRILTSSVISPSAKSVIASFISKYPGTRHISYDAVSVSAIGSANQESFGMNVIPSYHIDKASTLVSIGADFLLHWVSPLEHAKQYGNARRLTDGKEPLRHIQFESNLSLSGSNADKRIPVKPSEYGHILVALYNDIALRAGKNSLTTTPTKHSDAVKSAGAELWASRGKSLVVCSSNEVSHQVLVNAMNSILGSYGNTIDLTNHSGMRQGDDQQLVELMKEMSAKEVDALFVYNANPVYTLPVKSGFAGLMKNVGLKVSFSGYMDETALACDFICPDHHYLEAWNDAEPKKGHYSLGQPAIAPVFKSRAAQESLMIWSGQEGDYHNYIKNYWRQNIYPKSGSIGTFESFWVKSLQDGVVELASAIPADVSFGGNVDMAAKSIAGSKSDGGIELALYEKAGMGSGNQANNPWLQELPDPVSKMTWDNYVTISPLFAAELGIKQGNIIVLSANGSSLKAPVCLQPGQAYQTVGLAVGYGRKGAGKAGDNVGVNAFLLATIAQGNIQMCGLDASIQKTTDEDHVLATTQSHHTMMARALAKEATFNEYKSNPKAGNPDVLIPVTEDGKTLGKAPREVSLWKEHIGTHHLWGLSIDLNSCIGCGACVIGCQSENNVPVVGKDEVNRSREMHWIRIDRYYSSDADKRDKQGLEKAAENPDVIFQPVMCQHCNNAPCETVCPVAATTHSAEGMNMMAYNRCVGTRYCANNCPYKVRRFNWFEYSANPKFDYNMNDDLGRMVLNPDVVVRSRGVMEKCSMCVQNIQTAKLNAKKESRTVKDGEFVTACAQACPTNAIIVGDYNDPESRIAKMANDDRSYHLLEEINTQPNVIYQTKIRNRNQSNA
jgi:MoCo/4Fe-4S cofactor protein with predicted Tat translocation signal